MASLKYSEFYGVLTRLLTYHKNTKELQPQVVRSRFALQSKNFLILSQNLVEKFLPPRKEGNEVLHELFVKTCAHNENYSRVPTEVRTPVFQRYVSCCKFEDYAMRSATANYSPELIG